MAIDREKYELAKARVDKAWDAMQAAAAPFRGEYEQASEAVEELLDGVELVGKCLACDEPVFEGEPYQPAGEGEILCEEHAATLSEIVASWRFEIADDPDHGWQWNETVSSKEEYLARLDSLERDLSENGDRKVLSDG